MKSVTTSPRSRSVCPRDPHRLIVGLQTLLDKQNNGLQSIGLQTLLDKQNNSLQSKVHTTGQFCDVGTSLADTCEDMQGATKSKNLLGRFRADGTFSRAGSLAPSVGY